MSFASLVRRRIAPAFLAATLGAQAPQPTAAPAPAAPAATRLPFAPALYSLRATGGQGSSLVYLDAGGKETVVVTDSRKSKEGFIMGSGTAHATHFGAFNCTPDGSRVVYTLYGNPKKPASVNIGSMMPTGGGIGLYFSASAQFGERSFEGFYVWDQKTGKSQRLWDLSALEEIGKKWRITSDTSPKELFEELEVNMPTYLFHLKDEKFLWITASWLLLVDLKDRSCRPLDACDKDINAPLAESCIHAWQEADGTVRAFRRSRAFKISPEGKVMRETLDEGRWTSCLISAQGGLVVGNGEYFKHLDAAGASNTNAPVKAKHDDPFLLEDGAIVDHNPSGFAIVGYPNTLRCLEPDGKVRWTREFKACESNTILLREHDGKLLVLIRQKEMPRGPHRLVLNLETGAIEKDELWLGGHTGMSCPEMDQVGYCIPAKEGALYWVPSSCDLPEAVKPGKWAFFEDGDPGFNSWGFWMWMDPDLHTSLLWGRPLVDEMVVIFNGRPTPLPMWLNAGLAGEREKTLDTVGFRPPPGNGTEGTIPDSWYQRRMFYRPAGFARQASGVLTDMANAWKESLKAAAPTQPKAAEAVAPKP